MRCVSCDKPLTAYERTRKDTHGSYLDLCNLCFEPIASDVEVIDRPDLIGVVEEGDELS